MGYRRFTVKPAVISLGPGSGNHVVGFAVFDRDKRITVPFTNYDEALAHRDKINRLYLRWGW